MLYRISLLIILSLNLLSAENHNLPSLIDQLGAESFRDRKAAEKLLWEAAPDSVKLLKEAAKSSDPEVSFRAKRILDKISKGIFPGLSKELQNKINEFWGKKESDRSNFIVSLYNSEGSKSISLINRLLKLANNNGKPVNVKELFNNQNFKQELALSNDVDTSYSLLRFYAEEGFPADFLNFAVHLGKVTEEVKYYKNHFKKNNSHSIEKLYLALCRADENTEKVTELSNAIGRDSTAARLAKLESYSLPVLIELNDNNSQLAIEAANLFTKKFIAQKPLAQKELKAFIDKFKTRDQNKLIDNLLMLGERQAALTLAQEQFPGKAIAIFAAAGQVKEAVEHFQKHSESLQAKLAIAKVYQEQFAYDKLKGILNKEMLSQVSKKELESFIIPYSFTLNESELTDFLNELLSKNSSNQYVVKRTLFRRYKLSPYFLWNYLGKSNNTRLQNYLRLVKLQFTDNELKALVQDAKEKLKGNSGLAYNLSVLHKLYQKNDQAQEFLQLYLTSGYTLYNDIIHLIKAQNWQSAYNKLTQAKFDTYYETRTSFFTALCMKKLNKDGYKPLMRKALFGGNSSVYSRISILSDLVKAGLKDEALKYSKSLMATLYTENSTHFFRNILKAMSELYDLQGNFKNSYLKQILSTAVYIQTGNKSSSFYNLRYITEVYAKQFKFACQQNKTDTAYRAAQNYLEYYIQRSEFTEEAVNYLRQNNQQAKADTLYTLTNQKFAEAIEILPKSATLYNNKSWNSALCSKNFEQAEQEVKKALELEPDNAHYWDTLAEIYLRQGKLDESLKMSEKAYSFSFGEVSFRDRHNDFIKRISELKKD